MQAFMPRMRAARATACAWLPLEEAVTPLQDFGSFEMRW
jgi:hypothetical protein